MAGVFIVYTGDGKGKTSAAIGALMRTLCTGGKAAMIQFLKGTVASAECDIAKAYPNIDIVRAGSGFFTDERQRAEQAVLAAEGLSRARAMVSSGAYQLIVLDEVNTAVHHRLLDEAAVLALAASRGGTHLIITGRSAPASFIEHADIATEMRMIKHHYDKGKAAVRGIDL